MKKSKNKVNKNDLKALLNVVCQIKNGMPKELIENSISKLKPFTNEEIVNIMKNSMVFVESKYEDSFDVNELFEDFLKRAFEFKVNFGKKPEYLIISKKIRNRLENTLIYLLFDNQIEPINIEGLVIDRQVYNMKEIIFEKLVDLTK